jgi:hypothetical protein
MNTPDHTDVYFTAEFIDGPLAGSAEERVLVRGTHDEKLSQVALVDGIESIFRYFAVDNRMVAGKLHVRYTFNAPASDTFTSEDENE